MVEGGRGLVRIQSEWADLRGKVPLEVACMLLLGLADVACAARREEGALLEATEQLDPPALGGLVEVGTQPVDGGHGGGLGLLRQLAKVEVRLIARKVGVVGDERALGRVAIATGASDLLVVVFDGLWRTCRDVNGNKPSGRQQPRPAAQVTSPGQQQPSLDDGS